MRQEEGTFESADGLRLFKRAWPADGKATVVIVHGFAEHSGRYAHVAERLVAGGYGVYAFDLRGHGRSEGRRVFVRSMDEHVADLERFVELARARSPNLPLFVLGHSMGGAVVAAYLTSAERNVRGAVLSGSALRGGAAGARLLQRLLLWIGRLVPKLPLAKLRSADVSRDPDVVAKYDSDPLVYRGRVPAGTAAAMIQAARSTDERLPGLKLPLFALHGAADGLVDPEASRRLHERAGSSDKTLRVYDGLYHEILNEPERDEVLQDILDWLDAHLP